VAKGFVIMATGNLKSGNYKSRNELDIAFANRFLIRRYDYMDCQSTYDLIFAYLTDAESGLIDRTVTAEEIKKFPLLAKLMEEIQLIFKKEYLTQSSNIMSEGGYANIELHKTVFSTRTLIQILQQWLPTGSKPEARLSLDEAMGRVLLGNAELAKESGEQLFLLDLMLRFGFFNGWKAADFKEKLKIAVKDADINAIQAKISTLTPDQNPHFQEALRAQNLIMQTASLLGFESESKKLKIEDKV